MITFLKFIYTNGNIQKEGKLPSIVITEIIIQNYYNNFKKYIQQINPNIKSKSQITRLIQTEKIKSIFEIYKYSDIGFSLLELLEETINNLKHTFAVYNSGGHKENFLNNHKNRNLDKTIVINTLIQIYNEVENYYNYYYVRLRDTILRNVLYGQNRMLILLEDTYQQYKNCGYKNSTIFTKKINECIRYAQPIIFC
jgi:hypothetical protein